MAPCITRASVIPSLLLLTVTSLLFMKLTLAADPCRSRITYTSIYGYSNSVSLSVSQSDTNPNGGGKSAPYLSVSLWSNQDPYSYGTAEVYAQCISGNGGSVSASCSVPGTYCVPGTYETTCVSAILTISASGKGTKSYSSMWTYKSTYWGTTPPSMTSDMYKSDSFTCTSSCSFAITVSNPSDATDVWLSGRVTQFEISSGVLRPRYCPPGRR